MIIGILQNPTEHKDWPQIKAFLEPAAKLGRVPILDEGEVVFVVYENGLEGAATAFVHTDGVGEIPLVGGRNYRRWIGEMDRTIGEAMKSEGMRAMRAYGRKGWKRVLKDWTVIAERDGVVGYERTL